MSLLFKVQLVTHFGLFLSVYFFPFGWPVPSIFPVSETGSRLFVSKCLFFSFLVTIYVLFSQGTQLLPRPWTLSLCPAVLCESRERRWIRFNYRISLYKHWQECVSHTVTKWSAWKEAEWNLCNALLKCVLMLNKSEGALDYQQLVARGRYLRRQTTAADCQYLHKQAGQRKSQWNLSLPFTGREPHEARIELSLAHRKQLRRAI